jgi:heme/copper-type cytochrome/quinol oxidase subunit 3
MILSDVVFVLAMFLGFIYLRALNTQGAFKGGESAPAVAASAVLAVAAIVAALSWQWGRGGLSSGESGRVRSGVVFAFVLTVAALVGDLLVFAGLNFAVPFHAYASGIETFVLYHGFHLLVTVIVGGLVMGRLFSGRLAGRDYVLKAAGYWFWWVAAVAVMTTLLTAFIK